MLNVIRKIVIWIIGLPILLISICFITVASMLTTVGTFVFKSISVLVILLTGFFILVKVMPVNSELIPMILLSVGMFWIPELMAIPVAGVLFIQKAIWEMMID